MTAVHERQADGLFPGVPDDVYHASTSSLSVSGAKLLLPPSCPAKFRYHQDHPRLPKKVWDFGHVAHRMLLGEGASFLALDPAVHGLKKDGSVAESPAATAGWKAAAAEARASGLVPIHVEDADTAAEMAETVRADPVAGPLFEHGDAETSLYLTDPASGVQLRGRTDWLTDDDCVDYKTSLTANPAELERRFYGLRYFMQAAWYLDLLAALGRPVKRFTFVVQEKEPPFVAQVVRYDDEALAAGRRENRRAIDLYAQCQRAREWPGYARGPVTLSLPKWAQHEQIQADANDLIAELEGLYQS